MLYTSFRSRSDTQDGVEIIQRQILQPEVLFVTYGEGVPCQSPICEWGEGTWQLPCLGKQVLASGCENLNGKSRNLYMASSFGRMTGPTNLDQFVDTGKRVRGVSPSDPSLQWTLLRAWKLSPSVLMVYPLTGYGY